MILSEQIDKRDDLPNTTTVNNTIDINPLVHIIRDKQVILDYDLAFLYQVETGALNRAMKRNIARFPEDFCFQLTKEEYENLKCQIGISSAATHGGRRTMPYAFNGWNFA